MANPLELWIGMDEGVGDYLLIEQRLLPIQIGQHTVQRCESLLHALLNVRPLGLRNDDRKQVKGPRAIHAFRITINVVDDSVLTDDFFRLSAVVIEALDARCSEGVYEPLPMRPNFAHAV